MGLRQDGQRHGMRADYRGSDKAAVFHARTGRLRHYRLRRSACDVEAQRGAGPDRHVRVREWASRNAKEGQAMIAVRKRYQLSSRCWGNKTAQASAVTNAHLLSVASFPVLTPAEHASMPLRSATTGPNLAKCLLFTSIQFVGQCGLSLHSGQELFRPSQQVSFRTA